MPIQCTTLLRSFESPERPDIYDEDGQSSETVKKEICRNLDQELDLNLLNEDMNTSGDNQEHCKNYKKWVVRKNQSGSEMLACKFSDTEENKTEEVLNLLQYTSICSALLAEESVSSSFPIGFLSEIIDSKQCQTLESVLASIENQENLQTSHVGPEKKLSSHNIWSRRGNIDNSVKGSYKRRL
ncbi:hypothetical protein OIU76_002131, partial [Salix suchowensis]